jgi:hypothetical protein
MFKGLLLSRWDSELKQAFTAAGCSSVRDVVGSAPPTRYTGAIRASHNTPTLQYSITLMWLRKCGQLLRVFVQKG